MHRKKLLTVSIFSLLFSGISSAQEKTNKEESATYEVEEIIVTARKREESLQEIPVAVTAFSSQLIEDADIQSVEDIALMTPGLTFAPLFGGKIGNPVIRGTSTTIGEPNVGFFVDGIYQESRVAMESMFGDEIERIEVAKGPQSALYGRNTFAGAINYITKKPDNESGGKFEATIGNEGKKEAKVYYSGPIAEDKLYYRIGAMHSSFDGFYTNELTNTNLDESQSNIFSLSLLAYPTENLEMVFRVGVENTNDGDDAIRFIENNINFLPPLGDFQLRSGELPSLTSGFAFTPGYNYRDNTNSSLKLEWDLDNVVLTSITGYNDLETDSLFDADYSAIDLRFGKNAITEKEISQEIRLSSTDQSIRWMVGAFYYDLDKNSNVTDAYTSSANVSPLGLGRFPSLQSDINESTQNVALFGSIGYDLSDQLSLTLSGRYFRESKDIDLTQNNLTNNEVGTFNDSATFNNFTPKIALDYQLTEDMMVYTSIAKAVKAGGFNSITLSGAIADNERTYDEETSLNYEIGVKSSWMDNKVVLNLAAFYIDWQDQIVRALGDSGATLNINAGETTSKGFELELFAKPSQNWDLTGGLAYTDANYDKYTFGAIAALGLNPILDGNTLQFVSKLTANASVQYISPITFGNYDWKTRLDALYQSEQTIQALDDVATIPARTMLNFRTTFENDKYGFTIWAKNLLNNDDAIGSVILPNSAVWNAAGFGLRGVQAFQALTQAPNLRTFGITASIKF